MMKGMKTLRLLSGVIFAIAPLAVGQETRIVRAIEYRKLSPLKPEQVIQVLHDRGVKLAVEQPYSADDVERAKTVLSELLAQSGRPNATVDVTMTTIPPRSLKIVFTAVEK